MGKHRLNIEEKKPKEELAATRTRTPRFPNSTNNRPESGSGVNRSATNGSGSRRGRDFRNEARSPSSDEGRTNQAAWWVIFETVVTSKIVLIDSLSFTFLFVHSNLHIIWILDRPHRRVQLLFWLIFSFPNEWDLSSKRRHVDFVLIDE